jgi:hypothetical protein
MEAKGTMAEFASRALSNEKLGILAMKLGVDPTKITPAWSKRQKALFIFENMSENHLELAIKSIIDSSKKATWDEDLSTELIPSLNYVLERTMKCKTNENGELLPIFDPALGIELKQTYIEKRLAELGFNKSLIPYQDALKIYSLSSKGSISQLRVTLEDLTNEILRNKKVTPHKNFNNRLEQLRDLRVLNEIDTIQCPTCNRRKQDSEFNYAYDFYALLSHYGNHPSDVTEEVADWLYTSTSAFIWFILKRYEKLPATP